MGRKKNGTDSTKLIRTTSRRLPVQLDETERLEFADRLAHCEAELSEFNADAESQKKQLKAREAEILARRSTLANIVESRKEPRDVEVQAVANYSKGVMEEWRMDTGELISTRRLDDAERQEELIPPPVPDEPEVRAP